MLLRNSWQGAARAALLPLMLLVPLSLAPLTGRADILEYGQSFESMLPTDSGALGADGWLVFGNVWLPTWAYDYGYGTYPAPNDQPPDPPGPAFSQLVTGQGGPSQEFVQLSVISDYENVDAHGGGKWIESNLFQESVVGGANVGETWHFEFDAKAGDLLYPPTYAQAFIKTLDPSNGYLPSNYRIHDTTSLPTTWGRYGISITIDAGLVGQIFQFGFSNICRDYAPSAIYYDNITLSKTATVDVPPTVAGSRLELSTRGNPASGRDGQVLAFSVPRDGRVLVRVFDVTGALVSTLMDGEVTAGAHQVTWRGNDASGRAVPAGLYLAEVVAGPQRAVTKLHRLR